MPGSIIIVVFAYHNTGDLDAAIDDYSKSISLAPENAWVYSVRGAAYGAKGDLDAAIDDYSKAISLNPEDAGTL